MRQASPIYLVAGLVSCFLIWAYHFEIDESVRATGSIAPAGRIQIVQVADGGVLEALYINEGDRVVKGQVIAKLEDTRASARKSELDAQLAALQVRRMRAQAEASGTPLSFVDLPAQWSGLIEAQRALFLASQDRQQKAVDALASSVSLAKREYDMMSKLTRGGDATNIQLLQAQRDFVDRTQALEDAKLQYRTQALGEIAEIDGQLFSLKFSIDERENIVAKTTITAPKSGIVTSLKYATLGASVSAGEAFVSIAPIDETLELELEIDPTDVGSLRLGMPIKLSLGAFDPAIFGTVTGQLKLISADVVPANDATRKAAYFKGVADVDWASNSRIDASLLRPGMTATVDIKTGSRTVLLYLFKPLLRGSSTVFTER
ncbi:HlyD family efflux transporter periplasmic adaptor subunit [Litorivicinus lipolyticus]|uniref:HlyD family efflux transporter periplasmic adaptor subunit n=1 Tax=Litorivicinus lipolyticus TaxID=418701 RepID=A0A5Q2QGP6_9GAMM|nr:HlyD family efflux transporter periplasmic adaptor subunit [Litorivicinus lipolyticus]QGG80185.1 HlyD family efflux transporter periplasmic adaptor subunit [Litorivicinus lipolyticus]